MATYEISFNDFIVNEKSQFSIQTCRRKNDVYTTKYNMYRHPLIDGLMKNQRISEKRSFSAFTFIPLDMLLYRMLSELKSTTTTRTTTKICLLRINFTRTLYSRVLVCLCVPTSTIVNKQK